VSDLVTFLRVRGLCACAREACVDLISKIYVTFQYIFIGFPNV
jgi:hypothetical protein